MAKALYEITQHESGAVQYADGRIWIGNWVGVPGIPHLFAATTIGLGEELTAKICAVPQAVIQAMQQHEFARGDEPSKTGFLAWAVNDSIVVTHNEWA